MVTTRPAAGSPPVAVASRSKSLATAETLFGVPTSVAPTPPYRWDLTAPDQLGSLLHALPQPKLWFLGELTECAAKVVARSGGGDMYFVGRSADSVFDLLSGAAAETAWRDRLHHLPLSLAWDSTAMSPEEVVTLRAHLSAVGLAPAALARARRPVVLVDLVYVGRTFRRLYRAIRHWVDDDREAWSVVRTKLRFVGITERAQTSPNTWRWQQHAAWTREIPARAVVNVSVSPPLWDYLGNVQHKLTRSFHRGHWTTSLGPQHDKRTRAALREAVALVEQGRSRETRDTLVRLLAKQPAMAEHWLRGLVVALRR